MAIKYFAGNRLTGVSGDTKPTTLPTGTTFLETNTDDLYFWDGDSWNIVAGDSIAQTLSNKTMGTQLLITELGSSPGTPSSGFGTLYARDNNKLYFKADDGTESDLTAGVGSTGSIGGASDTTFTSINDAALIIYDTATLTWRDADMSGVATINDTGVISLSSAAITGQTAESAVNNANDFILIYDASASALRKMSVANLIAGGVSTDTLSALNDTTISSVSSAQVIIYDGTDSWDNKTVSGDITINTSGVTAIGTDKVTGTMIHANAVDDSSLEQSGTAFRVKAVGVTNAMLAGSIVNAKLSNSAITIGGTATSLGGTITALTALTDLDLTSGDKTIFDTVGANTLTIGASTTTVNIAGDLTVSGDATTFNTATVSVEDPLMILASNNNSADAVDIGFYGLYDTSGSQDLYSGLFRDANDSGKWKLFKDLQAAPTTTVNTSGTGYAVGTIVANVEGNITGSAGTSTGLAGSATILATARTISASGDITWTSASFNGSQNVTSVAAITADVIINADVKSDAAIAYSKLAALAAGNILVGNGSNVATSVNPSGDIDVTNAGVFSIAAGVIVNADVNSSAAIVDTKLATISTADKVAGGAIQIDSGTDGTGITIADADKFLVDDGGATKYVNASQLKTYASGDSADKAFAIAMAVAL